MNARIVGLSAIVLTTTLLAASAGGFRSSAVVAITATLEKDADQVPAGKSVVVFHLDIKPGRHLIANPPSEEDLKDSELRIMAGAENRGPRDAGPSR